LIRVLAMETSPGCGSANGVSKALMRGCVAVL
jgi:hypothetical protein